MQTLAGLSATAKKRQRSENWLEEDKVILKELVKERVHVLENKNTDSNTNSKKVAAWKDLKASFDMMAQFPRTLAQLKAQWSLIKMGAKKQKSFERRERLRTGGGPQPETECVSGDDIAVWLPNEFHIDSNEFDSDKINIGIYNKVDNVQKSNEIKKNEQLEEPQIVIIAEKNEKQMTEADTSLHLPIDVVHVTLPAPSTSPLPEKLSTAAVGNESKCTKAMKHRLKKNKVSKSDSGIDPPAEKIAINEIACRQELHKIQMENEQQKKLNLKLKEELLQEKIKYYKNK